MSPRRTPPRPDGAQASEDEWARFYEYFAHAKIRRIVRIVSRLPSPPRCEACGNPFGGPGGWLMRRILEAVGYGSHKGPRLEVGIGLDIGPAYVGIVGDGDIRDFTAIGDVVNTASRLQSVAQSGQIVMSEAVARIASVPDGTPTTFSLKGKTEPVAACVLTVGH